MGIMKNRKDMDIDPFMAFFPGLHLTDAEIQISTNIFRRFLKSAHM